MSVNQEPSAPVAAPQRGWWSRNWLWFVPTLLLGLALVCCGGIFGAGLFFVSKVQQLEPYLLSLAAVAKDEKVIEAIGEPIEPTGFPSKAEVNISGNSGEARLNYDVKGPKGIAKVQVTAKLVAGKWGLPDLRVTLPDGKQIKIDTSKEGDLDEAPPFKP